MAQAVFVQEQALANLKAENEQLRAELDQAAGGRNRAVSSPAFSAAAPASPGRPSTLRGRRQAFAPGSVTGPRPQQHHGRLRRGGRPSPMGRRAVAARRRRRVPGHGALSAAGVAGGMMIANALTNAFSGDNNPPAMWRLRPASEAPIRLPTPAMRASRTALPEPGQPGPVRISPTSAAMAETRAIGLKRSLVICHGSCRCLAVAASDAHAQRKWPGKARPRKEIVRRLRAIRARSLSRRP